MKLKPQDIELLTEIVLAHAPAELKHACLPVIQRGLIEPQHVDSLLRFLVEEFTASGLQENSEPNARGLRIENLIDAVGRFGERRSSFG